MATGPLNLKGKLHEQDAYLVSEQRHQDGSPVIVAVVANPQYRALFKTSPLLLAQLENLLAWANIQDDHSPQSVELRDSIRLLIAKAKGQ